jgi:hypothetical protein
MKLIKNRVIAAVISLNAFTIFPINSGLLIPAMASTDMLKPAPVLVMAENDLASGSISLSLTTKSTAGAVESEIVPGSIASAPSPAVTAAPVVSQPIPAPAELDQWFDSYGSAFNVDPNILKVIANCESHFNPNAASGPYGGMYQYLASTWSSTRNAMGLDPDPALRFSAEESIKTTAWKISVGGIGAWPHCSKKAIAVVGNPIKPGS